MQEILLVILGFLLGLIPGWMARRSRLKVHWSALRAEIELCSEHASTYLNDKIMAPLYRLPIRAYEASFSVLLTDAAVKEGEVRTLLKFYGHVEDFNRGLDNAAHLATENNTGLLKSEFKRNCVKAQQLIPPQAGDSNLYTAAVACVGHHVE